MKRPSAKRAAADSIEGGLRAVVSNSPIVLFAIDADGVFTLSEGKGLAVLGLKPGEVVGRSAIELYAGYPRVVANLKRALAGHDFVDRVDLDGITWETHYTPLGGKGVIGLAVDITERRRAEALLHQQSAVVRASMDGMALVDVEGRFVYLNDAYAKVHGYASPEHLVGKSWRSLYPSEELHRLDRDVLPAFGREGQWRGESVGRRRDGTNFPEELSLSSIEEGGFVFVIRDITRAKTLDRERENLLSVEKLARSEAEMASRAKDEFLAMISHELRTPMTAMLGWTWLLRAGSLADEDRVRAIDVIERNMKLQAQIIEDLLDVSSIVTGKLRLEPSLVDAAPVVAAALEVVRPSAQARNIKLEASLDATVGPVMADPDRLQQIVWNLLSNAVKFTPEGGWVRTWIEGIDGHLLIGVEDSGPGIPEEFLPHVFERFRQAESAITRAHRGLGLGLAIVRHLVELHGGTVYAESPGSARGARFTVSLPLARVVPGSDAVPVRGPRLKPEALPSLKGVRVLVVDDEADTRAMLAAVLEQCGATVRLASNASEAMGLFATEIPDVLVSDISMPDTDGYELLRRIRALPADKGGKVAAAALTACAKADDRTRALLAGYQIYIPKPVEPTELAAVVGNLAGRVA
ncbi:MAG: PAS domain S-box protein [Elusimicrobia bacterium]|nr:PAS domain S-box protein [Elusimicrobiota bacterium]